MPAREAFELAKWFEFYYTPKSASWLNMIEIEFSALVKQWLGQRIATQQKLSEEIEPIIKERNDKRIKINWQFSIHTARTMINSCYCKVNPANRKYKKN